MIRLILVAILGGAFALIPSLFELKKDNKLTKMGILLVVLGIVTSLLTLSTVITEWKNDKLKENQIKLEDIKILISAEYFNPKISDEKILEETPTGFRIHNAFIADQSLDITFERADFIYRPTGYRSVNRIELIYFSKNIQKSIQFNDEENKIRTLLDLKGKIGEIRVPVGKFQIDSIGESEWRFSSSFNILEKDYVVNAQYIPDTGIVIDRNKLKFYFH